MDLQELNKATSFKLLKNIKNLDINRKYKIVRLRFSKTKYGDSLLAETENFSTYLPRRFYTYFEKEGIEHFNDGLRSRAVYLVSKGALGTTTDIIFTQDEEGKEISGNINI